MPYNKILNELKELIVIVIAMSETTHLSHFLEVVVAAEYEKMECNIHNITNIIENNVNKSNDMTSSSSDSESSQKDVRSPSASSPLQNSNMELKRKRPKYSDAEQRRVIELYDSFQCKVTAMKVINQMNGYESIYKRKIERWKRSDKSMGRPVSQEFEKEVIEEYRSKCNGLSNVDTYVTSAQLKKCALAVFDRDYWDEKTNTFTKKWHIDKRTCNLCFTSKWIAGLLKRSRKSVVGVSSSDSNFTGNSTIGSDLALRRELLLRDLAGSRMK